ncbi:MAG: hypothetical protein HW394_1291, partial [Acidobacteria bacterium]|nr:hypothetical protein [Acidobacteriota bacterium]
DTSRSLVAGPRCARLRGGVPSGGAHMTDRLGTVRCLAVASVLLFAPALAVAQESRSAQLAAELVKLLEASKLDSIAAKIEGDQYVGALYFPGTQLLVVKARYIVPERMDVQLAGKNYRDVYVDLNSASVPASKIFISDPGANGLQARRRDNQPYDTVDMGGKSYAFDGDWRKAKISEQEYMKIFQTSDAEYTGMLEALLAQLKKTS